MLQIIKIPTQSFPDQKPGTSGLRKKTKVFQQPHYLENFVQAIFNTLRSDELAAYNRLVVGGDGRFYNLKAIQIITKIACANGVDQVIIPVGGLISTPGVSAFIREINTKVGNCIGGIILTASHNPGGQNQDFGIKFNSRNGGPANQAFTDQIANQTKHLTQFKDCPKLQMPNLKQPGQYTYQRKSIKGSFKVTIVEAVQSYIRFMQSLFDFKSIQNLTSRADFRFIIDGMNGVAGIYANKIFKPLGANCINCQPSQDFKGGHPDPNLTYAKELVKELCIFDEKPSEFDFGAACDGDADRNMILGKNFFVTPSDSLALLVANHKCFLTKKLIGAARSMPTSGALDKVTKALNIDFYQVPTGWKFFGNLMDEGMIQMCGQQSFGTGSSHVREKDGIWTILAWLSVLAEHNKDRQIGKLKSVKEIVEQFWRTYGRNYYCRYDYQNIDNPIADKIWENILSKFQFFNGLSPGNSSDIYQFVDPVDKSVSKNQGIRFKYSDGSRIVFRKSGTGSVGVTIRVYFEKYERQRVCERTESALESLIRVGEEIGEFKKIGGIDRPTVIT